MRSFFPLLCKYLVKRITAIYLGQEIDCHSFCNPHFCESYDPRLLEPRQRRAATAAATIAGASASTTAGGSTAVDCDGAAVYAPLNKTTSARNLQRFLVFVNQVSSLR